jgi:biopolymer transport protein ExbB/TolQ
MYKFLLKLALVVMGLYLLSQIPAFQSYSKAIVDSFYQKAGNVAKEVDRVKDKVDDTKDKIDKAKAAVDNFAADIIQTKKNAEEGLTAVKKTIDSVSSALNQEKDQPAADAQPATTTK